MPLSDDQLQFQNVVQRFFADKSSVSDVRKLMETDEGYDKKVWQQMGSELALTGIHIPEEFGGSGFGPVELGIVEEQMGHQLFCGPFFSSSVLSAIAIMEIAGVDTRASLLPDIAEGNVISTLVWDNLGVTPGHGIQWSKGQLNGEAPMAIDAGIADCLLVIAFEGDQPGLYRIDRQSAGLSIESLEVIDPTRKLYRVTFEQVAAEALGKISDEQLRSVFDQCCLALAHEMIGGAQYLLDSTVEYTKLRVQFGRQIGSFQALKHKCAELLMDLETTKASVRHASECYGNGTGESYLPVMAKAMASDTYMSLAKSAIQLRGGIGFTWENDTHLWFKRAKCSEVLLGNANQHREEMICRMEEA